VKVDLEDYPGDDGVIHTAYSSDSGLAVVGETGNPGQRTWRAFLGDVRDHWPVAVPAGIYDALMRAGFPDNAAIRVA
jgi:hypothetical protein